MDRKFAWIELASVFACDAAVYRRSDSKAPQELRCLDAPMCSENYYATFFVTNLGIVADRPRIKMLAARPQYADHVVTLVPDVFLTEAWTVVPDMAGDHTC